MGMYLASRELWQVTTALWPLGPSDFLLAYRQVLLLYCPVGILGCY